MHISSKNMRFYGWLILMQSFPYLYGYFWWIYQVEISKLNLQLIWNLSHDSNPKFAVVFDLLIDLKMLIFYELWLPVKDVFYAF